jgi:NitT/TauT family transport system ATP-binding protein
LTISVTFRATVVLEDVAVDLPDERDQLTTRSCREFADNRGRV